MMNSKSNRKLMLIEKQKNKQINKREKLRGQLMKKNKESKRLLLPPLPHKLKKKKKRGRDKKLKQLQKHKKKGKKQRRLLEN